jgi:hypothetical protein
MDNQTESILLLPDAIALLINENAIEDLRIFLYTLQLWNTNLPTLYIYCTSTLPPLEYKGKVRTKTALNTYSTLTRQQMEQMPSKQGLTNLFHDFTVEKCGLMDWAIKEHNGGVLFCDADLCWLGPLPQLPQGTTLALSPHEIRPADEELYGTFNAGLLYMSDLKIVEKWLLESLVSNFFEQLSLNEVAKNYPYYKFTSNINYGWWRMFQAPVSSDQRKAEWSIHRHDSHSGLCVKGKPVLCVHTHWKTTDYMTKSFNSWLVARLDILKKNKKVASLLRCVQ